MVQLKGAELDEGLFRNYNLAMIPCLLPIFIAILLKILSKTLLKAKEAKFSAVFGPLIGEFSFYGSMSFSYILFVTMAIQFRQLKPDNLNILELVFGSILLLASLVYFVFLCKKPALFG